MPETHTYFGTPESASETHTYFEIPAARAAEGQNGQGARQKPKDF
jgi:hypothetical protein